MRPSETPPCSSPACAPAFIAPPRNPRRTTKLITNMLHDRLPEDMNERVTPLDSDTLSLPPGSHRMSYDPARLYPTGWGPIKRNQPYVQARLVHWWSLNAQVMPEALVQVRA